MERRLKRERREYLFAKGNLKITTKSKQINSGQEYLYEEQRLNIDDEYSTRREPKILLTTSRNPSSKLIQFTKEMKLILPESQRINRGNYVLKELVDACLKNDATDLIILHEHRGIPDGMVISHLPNGPTAYFTLHNVLPRHEIPDGGKMSLQYPHLIFDNFNSKLGERVKSILKYLFPVPKEDSKRVMTFSNQSDFISFRHHVFTQVGDQVSIVEVGPRFELQIYQIKLGTVENENDTEWVYRPYMNTAKKRLLL